MTMNNVLTLIGFARKSGNLILGETLCVEGIKRKKISLMIIATDLNDSTKRKIVQLCESEDVSYKILFTKDVLSKSIGKDNYGLFGISNKKFSRALIEKIEALTPEVNL